MRAHAPAALASWALVAALAGVAVSAPGAALAQVPQPPSAPPAAPAPPAPAPPAQPLPPLDPGASLATQREVAPGGLLRVRLRGLTPPARIESRVRGRWRGLRPARRLRGATLIRAPGGVRALRVRGRGADGRYSRSVRVRVRALRLAAVGDINFGDGPGAQIARFGPGYPWTSVGPRLRKADIAFGNLECAVSRRGRPQDKQYVFRGHPASVRAMRRNAGMDVVNLANNHAGDYGDLALLDTLRTLRANGVLPVGAGANERSAYSPRVIERLGLRIAFVGFSEVLPFDFRAVGNSPGTSWAFPGRISSGVRRAARQADVVIATFHWGIERDTRGTSRQRQLADIALRAGATAVIGAHPHVLQPIARRGRRLVAYSLGNFVFSAASAGTQRTGILELDLARRAVRRHRFIRATIVASRPILQR